MKTLLVCSESKLKKHLEVLLEGQGHSVVVRQNNVAGWHCCRHEKHFELMIVVTGSENESIDWPSLIKLAKGRDPDLVCVAIGSRDSQEGDAKECNSATFLLKPLDKNAFLDTLRNACHAATA